MKTEVRQLEQSERKRSSDYGQAFTKMGFMNRFRQQVRGQIQCSSQCSSQFEMDLVERRFLNEAREQRELYLKIHDELQAIYDQQKSYYNGKLGKLYAKIQRLVEQNVAEEKKLLELQRLVEGREK
jgi:hypothetical protein